MSSDSTPPTLTMLLNQVRAASDALNALQELVSSSRLFSARPYEEATEEMKWILTEQRTQAANEVEVLADMLDEFWPELPQGGYAKTQVKGLRNPTGYSLTWCATYAKNWDEFATKLSKD